MAVPSALAIAMERSQDRHRASSARPRCRSRLSNVRRSDRTPANRKQSMPDTVAESTLVEAVQRPDAAIIVAQRQPVPGRSLVLAACLMATFMAAIESTIVSTTLHTIVGQLGGFDLFSWVFTIFLLTQAVSIPIYGRLADMFGRKKVFFAGVGLFITGAILCGFAWGMVPLICFRAIEGMGAGAVQPIAVTILGDIYTPSERAHVQGLISSVFGVAAVIGP